MMETRNHINPFYVPSSRLIRTSAEIIREARAAMQSKSNSGNQSPRAIRLIHTKRPFTPREKNRTFFGGNNVSRPPSAITLNQVKFHDIDTSFPRLSGVHSSGLFGFSMEERAALKRPGKMRLPAIDNVRKNNHYRGTLSLDNLPEETEAEPIENANSNTLPSRAIHSSPMERTDSDYNLKPNCLLPNKNEIVRPPLELPKKSVAGLKPLIFNDKQNKNHNYSNKNELFLNKQYSPLKSKSFDSIKYSRNQIINEETVAEPEGISKQSLDQQDQTKNKILEFVKSDKTIDSPPEKHGRYLNYKTTSVNKNMTIMDIDNALQDNQINEARAVANDLTKEVLPETTETLIDSLRKIVKESDKEQEVLPLFEKLYQCLEKENVALSKNNKLKSSVLKTIYVFIENASEPLLLYIARIALLLRVSGANLSAVCKLVFRVSRHDQNDKLFMNTNILELFVESLGRASPLDDSEACIYGYGALKFLTMNNQILEAALKLGILELMVLHIKIVNKARVERIMIPEPTKHALFQLTGSLRNVASEESTLPKYVSTGTVYELCQAMELFSADLDLISNISRTLSIISTNELCCEAIVDYKSSFLTFIKIFAKFPGRQDIIVRLGYALGNIMAKCHNARLKFYKEPGAVGAILTLLENYLEKDFEIMKNPDYSESGNKMNSPELGSDGSIEDVVIKMIRIIANMCMHPTAGCGLTCFFDKEEEEELYDTPQQHSLDGNRFIQILLMVLRRKSTIENEELILSSLSTLNNLSYYAKPEATRDGPFLQYQLEIAQALSTLMMTANEDCLVEITRVFGNLTRNKETRDFMLETGGTCQLVRCLERENRDLLCTTTGVLVNLMGDWDKRLAFKEDNGVAKLITILEKKGENDWKLSCLVCQALWNFCIDSTHLYAAFGIQATNRLLSILIDLLDEERLFGIADGCDVDEITASNPEYQQWELFAGVATNLLEKIENYLETLEAFRNKV
uniref:Armadillo repeat-containing protein 2 n=1 Tax=Clastoptera arizonana TaxID=38151 RepID=A0A1B6CHS7_9HEMI